jgi:hypothetical protein
LVRLRLVLFLPALPVLAKRVRTAPDGGGAQQRATSEQRHR